MWSEQGDVPHQVHGGHPGNGRNGTSGANSSAAALLSYDVLHRAPWDWRVSAYTFTKSIAAGAYLAPLLLGALGVLPFTSTLWGWTAPLTALFALLVTGGLLIWDLEHPERFWMVLTRPQWRSWLARGGVVITAYGAVLAAHLGLTLIGRADLTPELGWIGGPLAAMSAVYTAYLFAQARARDLWQSPMLPAHLLVQAVAAGAAVLLLASRSGAGATGAEAVSLASGSLWLFRGTLSLHLLLVVGEATMGHPTAHAALAARNMIFGAWGHFFWLSLAFGVLAVVVAGMSLPIAALAGLVSLLMYEHAFVQAGQSVPLA
jgi:formate-dependent nitrite reductase membrane component NrfD